MTNLRFFAGLRRFSPIGKKGVGDWNSESWNVIFRRFWNIVHDIGLLSWWDTRRVIWCRWQLKSHKSQLIKERESTFNISFPIILSTRSFLCLLQVTSTQHWANLCAYLRDLQNWWRQKCLWQRGCRATKLLKAASRQKSTNQCEHQNWKKGLVGLDNERWNVYV